MKTLQTCLPYRIRLTAICSLFAVLLQPVIQNGATAWAESAVNTAPPLNTDDGWRRTSHGWERITRWEASALDQENTSVPTYAVYGVAPVVGKIMPRSLSELHPVTIALSMLLASVLAYQYLPPSNSFRTEE